MTPEKSAALAALLIVASACMLLLNVGCQPYMNEAVRRERVLSRARFDLDCRDDIEIVRIDENVYGAIGCDQRATYALHQCSNNTWQSACTVILDRTSGDDAARR